jgi:hypothetical protein
MLITIWVTRPEFLTSTVLPSVANRPKILPQNAKVGPKKSQRPKKSAAEFSADLMTNGRKGAELF